MQRGTSKIFIHVLVTFSLVIGGADQPYWLLFASVALRQPIDVLLRSPCRRRRDRDLSFRRRREDQKRVCGRQAAWAPLRARRPERVLFLQQRRSRDKVVADRLSNEDQEGSDSRLVGAKALHRSAPLTLF